MLAHLLKVGDRLVDEGATVTMVVPIGQQHRAHIEPREDGKFYMEDHREGYYPQAVLVELEWKHHKPSRERVWYEAFEEVNAEKGDGDE